MFVLFLFKWKHQSTGQRFFEQQMNSSSHPKVIYNTCCMAVDTDILWQNADLVYFNMLFCVYYSLDQSERP